ncbi:hypothetical protein AXF42_Ash012910 [Apostasia shenzhenica]|uniref:Uncharacterized protein n=1 Tax=Apostasia shenzhenica TaxID=1088818 RepID=A0A2I0ARL3_9ASPA|nr:hypothetical protein AXF42_Ash012910 [Apostasia shenzhenica]
MTGKDLSSEGILISDSGIGCLPDRIRYLCRPLDLHQSFVQARSSYTQPRAVVSHLALLVVEDLYFIYERKSKRDVCMKLNEQQYWILSPKKPTVGRHVHVSPRAPVKMILIGPLATRHVDSLNVHENDKKYETEEEEEEEEEA